MARQTTKPEADGAAAGSFNRAVVVLRALAQEADRGTSLRDIVMRTGLPRPTVHRVLKLLYDANWIERDGDDRVHLGRDLVGLGVAAMARHPVQRIADPALALLARRIEQTVYLTLRVGDDAVCIARHEPENPIKTLVLQVGAREPLGIGAGGMAMLASLSDREADQVIARNLDRYRQRPGFDEPGFRRAYARAKSSGYASHEGLFRKGISGIGVAISTASRQPLAAISTAFVSDWLSQEQRDLCAKLLNDAAVALSGQLA